MSGAVGIRNWSFDLDGLGTGLLSYALRFGGVVRLCFFCNARLYCYVFGVGCGAVGCCCFVVLLGAGVVVHMLMGQSGTGTGNGMRGAVGIFCLRMRNCDDTNLGASLWFGCAVGFCF